jgi:hypothetical protein
MGSKTDDRNIWVGTRWSLTDPYTRIVAEVKNLQKTCTGDPYTIKKVIFHGPATIVYWADGSKTVVKATNEAFDPEKGLAMAIVKKLYGNKGNYFNEIKKWLPTGDDDT